LYLLPVREGPLDYGITGLRDYGITVTVQDYGDSAFNSP
jgi:hypothetical protein